jgi:hypothetical protein
VIHEIVATIENYPGRVIAVRLKLHGSDKHRRKSLHEPRQAGNENYPRPPKNSHRWRNLLTPSGE